ncbi:MAG: NAD(P)H-dependent oxidoreductase subunit E [Alphaproteobacteria bacterium]|nr:NAD(P)H-dependent oxidoreductase subunit E [Alphaproteobacteria bacterium]MCB9695535.1 NAD(P)H-dependent oxidoreductase subunit E [Alphaproteobacteria bacterium]
MDLRHLDTEPSREEREAVDAVIGEGETLATVPLREARRLRAHLLPALHALQDRVGRITEGGLGYVCRRLHVPPAEAWGVVTFYALFNVDEERPTTVAHVCDDVACRLAGAERICGELAGTLGPEGKAVKGRGWMRSPCLGLCDQAPAALLVVPGAPPTEVLWGGVDAPSVAEAVRSGTAPERGGVQPLQPREALHLLRRVGQVDPTDIDAWRRSGGGAGLRRALELGPAEVIALVGRSGLVGRGGAAFPTARKWEAVARQPARPHHLVCNADESEPGTFKDRVLMEQDPYTVVEGVAIAAFAVGSELARIYVRDEYPLARQRLQHAIDTLRQRGWLGDDVLGRGVKLDVELVRGAGAYICGEETALLNSMEGLRGEPRQKPPFPSDSGLFGQPTAINNVETLANVPLILTEGPEAWAARGVPGSAGTRLFCLAGHVRRPGVVEVGMGTTLREVIALGGGTPSGRPVRAVLLGGAAGGFVTADQLDVPLTFEDTRRIGATMGSGVVLVLDDSADIADLLRRITAFFRDESCGQCVPCRVGTVRMEEWVARRSSGGSADPALLDDLGAVLRDASICGLGQTAASAVQSAVRLGLLGGGR